MKKAILFVLIAGCFAANAQAQSLKDLLYSGKLKKDSNVVIRKGEDLSTRIDTGTKKPAEPAKAVTTAGAEGKAANVMTDSSGLAIAPTDSTTAVTSVAPNPAPPAKNNNQLWKEYTDSLVSTLKTDVLPSKKIKSGTYYLYVDYELGTEGQVDVISVVASPENDFLAQQVKERILYSGLQLTPVLDSSNKPRKVKRKYNFNITKE